MLGKGITQEDILQFVDCDDIMIFRHDNQQQINIAITKAKIYLEQGIEYDHDFDFDSPKRFSCTEFCDNVYGGLNYNIPAGTDNFCKNLTRKLSPSTIFPDDFLFASLKTVWRKE